MVRRIPTKSSSYVISKDWTSLRDRGYRACFKKDTSHKDNNNWMMMLKREIKSVNKNRTLNMLNLILHVAVRCSERKEISVESIAN